MENSQIDDFNNFAEEFSKKLNTFTEEEHSLRITIINADGTVLGDSSADISMMENHRLRPEIIQAEKSGIGIEIRKSSTTDIEYMYLAVKTDSGNILRVSVALSYIKSINGSIYMSTFVSILLSLLLATIIGLRLSTKFTKPIGLLTKHSHEVATGNLSHRIPYEPKNDELTMTY